MKPVGKVTGLFIYPIKSCRGIAVPEMEIISTGPRGDREWMLIDEKNIFLSQRSHPRLTLITTALLKNGIQVNAPGAPSLWIPPRSTKPQALRATIWKDTVDAETHNDEVNTWFSKFLHLSVRLVRLAPQSKRRRQKKCFSFHTQFPDSAPFLLMNEASVGDLTSRLPKGSPHMQMERFRPNIIVNTQRPYEEDHWDYLKIGNVEFPVTYACDRCSITTVDPATAEHSKEPLKTLATYRKTDAGITLGMRLVHRGAGRIQVGMGIVATQP